MDKPVRGVTRVMRGLVVKWLNLQFIVYVFTIPSFDPPFGFYTIGEAVA